MFPVDGGRFSGRFIEGRVLIRETDIEAYVSDKTDGKTTVGRKAAAAISAAQSDAIDAGTSDERKPAPKCLTSTARSKGGQKSRRNPWLQEAITRIVDMLETDETRTSLPAVWDWLCENAPPGGAYAFEPPISGCDLLYVEGDKLSFADQEGNRQTLARRSLERYIRKSKYASG